MDCRLFDRTGFCDRIHSPDIRCLRFGGFLMSGLPGCNRDFALAPQRLKTAGVRGLAALLDFEFVSAVCITCNSFYRVSHVFSARTNFIVLSRKQ